MAQFDTEEIVIGGSEWKTAPFRFNRMLIIGGSGGSSYIDVLLSGVSPLVLTNALGLNYIKAFGATEQRNIPSEYTQLEYLESSGGQKINTGLAGNDNYTIRAKFYDFGGGANCVVSGSDSRYGTNYIGRVSGSGSSYRMLLSNKKSSDITASIGLHTVEVNPQKITFDGIDYSWSADNNSTGQYLYLFYGYYSSELTARMRLYYYQVELDGVLLRNFIPAKRNSDNVLGMYDIVTGTFFTNVGTGTFTAGADIVPTPDTPIDIVCNNGVVKVNSQGHIYADGIVETVNAHGVNIIDTTQTRDTTGSSEFWLAHKNEITFNSANVWIWSVGENITTTYNYWNSSARSFAMPCKPGDVFLTKGYNGYPSATYSRRVYSFIDANYKVISRDVWTTETVMTAPSNAAYFFIEWAVNDNNIDGWVITRNTALPTDYEPYFNGGSATTEMLLKIQGITDEQNITIGNITRNIGIKVLDGTENWTANTNGYSASVLDESLYNHLICTHFINGVPTTDLTCSKLAGSANLNIHYNAITTVAQFKTWLANQYANGTPVIIVYPLATPTTETVTGQTLTASGNCTVTATGSLSNLELELSYKQLN